MLKKLLLTSALVLLPAMSASAQAINPAKVSRPAI